MTSNQSTKYTTMYVYVCLIDAFADNKLLFTPSKKISLYVSEDDIHL